MSVSQSRWHVGRDAASCFASTRRVACYLFYSTSLFHRCYQLPWYVARLETDNKNEGRPSLIDSRGLLHSLVLDVLQVHCCRNPSQGPRQSRQGLVLPFLHVYVSPFLRVISAFLACFFYCACLRLLACFASSLLDLAQLLRTCM